MFILFFMTFWWGAWHHVYDNVIHWICRNQEEGWRPWRAWSQIQSSKARAVVGAQKNSLSHTSHPTPQAKAKEKGRQRDTYIHTYMHSYIETEQTHMDGSLLKKKKKKKKKINLLLPFVLALFVNPKSGAPHKRRRDKGDQSSKKYTHTHTYTHIYIYMYVCMYVRMYICISMYILVCM